MGPGDAPMTRLVIGLFVAGSLFALSPVSVSAMSPAAFALCVEATEATTVTEAADASTMPLGKIKRCKKAIKKAWKACKKKAFSTDCATKAGLAVAQCGSILKGPWNFVLCAFNSNSLWEYFRCLTGLDWFDDDDEVTYRDLEGAPNGVLVRQA